MNINEIKHNLKTNIPVFKAGDTVRVKVKVVEGDNERLQAFDGVVIARRGSGISETFTVRKISFGIGVERIFPIHSPRVDSIEVLKIGKVRRAKLNYLTKLSGKAAERVAILIAAALKGDKQTKGKARLETMLRSGMPSKVFAVKDEELGRFCRAAKEYGVLYCVLKDKDANDGLTDIMVRADDASKVNRIFERFNLSTVDMAALRTEIIHDMENKEAPAAGKPEESPKEQLLDSLLKKEEPENPMMARSRNDTPSGQNCEKPITRDSLDAKKRPSVRKELAELKAQQEKELAKRKTKTKTRSTPKKTNVGKENAR